MHKSIDRHLGKVLSIGLINISVIAIAATPSHADLTGSEWLIKSCFYASNIQGSVLEDTHVFVVATYGARSRFSPTERRTNAVILENDICIDLKYKEAGKIYAIEKSTIAKIGSSTDRLNAYIDRLKPGEAPSLEVFYRGYFYEEDARAGKFPVFLSSVKENIYINKIEGKSIVARRQLEFYYGDAIAWIAIGLLLSLIALLVLYVFNLKRQLSKVEQQFNDRQSTAKGE